MSEIGRGAETRHRGPPPSRPAGAARAPWLAVAILLALVSAGGLSGAAAQDRPENLSTPFDSRRLTPEVLRYRVVVAGSEVGTVTTELRQEVHDDRPAFRATSTFRSLGGEVQEVSLWFDAETFRPLQTRGSGRQGQFTVSIDLSYKANRVRGRVIVQQEAGGAQEAPEEVNVALPPGTLDQNQLRYALVSAPLRPGYAFDVPIFDVTQGELLQLSLKVAAAERVEVPAGSFETFRVQMTGGQFPMTWHVTTQAPQRVVRQEFEAGGATVQIEMLPSR